MLKAIGVGPKSDTALGVHFDFVPDVFQPRVRVSKIHGVGLVAGKSQALLRWCHLSLVVPFCIHHNRRAFISYFPPYYERSTKEVPAIDNKTPRHVNNDSPRDTQRRKARQEGSPRWKQRARKALACCNRGKTIQ